MLMNNMDGELRGFLTFLIFDEQGRKTAERSGIFYQLCHGHCSGHL
jgi:hypothetical protein